MKLKETQQREYSHPIYAMGNPVYARLHSDTKGVSSSDLRAVSKGGSISTLNIEVYNLLGEQVLNVKPSANLTAIDLSNQPNGMYMLRVNGVGQVLNKRIIKQ